MPVLSFEQALATVLDRARNVPTSPVETVSLLESAGRVLAQPILADRDQPPFDRSTRDGFAVRAAEWSRADALRVVGQLRAGDIWRQGPLPTGSAIEITRPSVPSATAASISVLCLPASVVPFW